MGCLVSAPVAWLSGAPVEEAELLAHLGPGLAACEGAAPVPALDWNAFAFALGRRLLLAYAGRPDAHGHALEVVPHALVCIAAVRDLLGEGEQGVVRLAMIEASLRPAALFTGAPVALVLELLRWATRRVRRDRHQVQSLAALAAAAVEVHAELAALAGQDAEAAREAERAVQLADAREVLAGRGEALVAAAAG